VQQIANDKNLCAELLRTKWSEYRPGQPFDEAATVEIFQQVLADYAKVREALEHCADGMKQGGEIHPDQVEQYGNEVFDRIWRIIGTRPAKLAVDLANTLLKKTAGLDPTDRFHFKGHSPIAGFLEGRADLWHRATLEYVAVRRDTIARERT